MAMVPVEVKIMRQRLRWSSVYNFVVHKPCNPGLPRCSTHGRYMTEVYRAGPLTVSTAVHINCVPRREVFLVICHALWL